MTARWRKSSHSSHAGDNCVEIALSVTGRVKPKPLDPKRGYVVAGRGARRWYLSSRA